ncbi:MAG: zinc-dependent metalloprotease [Planctomycetota bacterium]
MTFRCNEILDRGRAGRNASHRWVSIFSRSKFRWVTLAGCATLATLLGSLPSTANAQPPLRNPVGGSESDDRLPDADKVTTGMEVTEGFFRIYQAKGKMYLEIPRRLLEKPFFLATSFAGGNAYHGWQWSDQLVSWERFEDKLLLVEQDLRFRSEGNAPVGDAVRRTYANRIVLALPIIGEGKGGNRGYVIDGKRMLAENATKFFGGIATALNPTLARFDKLKAFPHNCEIAVTMPTHAEGTLTTLHYSLARLPESRYRPRAADPRIGYFLTAFKDFAAGDAKDARFVRYINRWNLTKKDPTLALSPPEQPIVFYVEKTVPVRFRRAVREGILEWNKAFEKIGFYNAIEVRQQTDTEFTDLDPEDSRYNFFRWIASEEAFAMGPSRVNPLTGEIVDADVIFDDSMARVFIMEYDRLLSDLPDTFFSPRVREFFREHPEEHPFAEIRSLLPAPPAAEASADGVDPHAHALPLDPAAGRAFCRYGQGITHQLAVAALADLALRPTEGQTEVDAPDDYVYAVIKETVMHEIGHTLGLRHNFKASCWRTQAELDRADASEATVGSVMDYNPVNVVLDGGQKQFVTGTIGPYDYWAIEYGYGLDLETKDLAKIASRSAEKGLDYGTDDDLFEGDPTIAQFDAGTNPLEFAQRRLALVQALMPTLIERAIDDGEGYERVRRAFDALLFEVSGAAMIAARHVGGAYLHRDHKGTPEARPPLSVVPAEKQREALTLICRHILDTNALPIPQQLLSYLAAGRWSHWGQGYAPASYPVLERAQGVQSLALAALLNFETLSRIRNNELRLPQDESKLTIPELLSTLTNSVFAETVTQAEVGLPAMRQNLQRVYIDRLIRMANGPNFGPPIVPALARAQLKDIHERLERWRERSRDPYTSAHVDDGLSRIDRALRAQYQAF